MTDHDPLASIEALLNDLRMSDSRYSTIRDLDLDHRLRDALAEAREAMDALVSERDVAESERDDAHADWAAENVRAQRAEAERDAALARVAESRALPCDGGCVDAAEEDCSRHGRTPADLWRIIDEIRAERDAAREALDHNVARIEDMLATLSMVADRLDEFTYDELRSVLDDDPLDQWGEIYKSRLTEAREALAVYIASQVGTATPTPLPADMCEPEPDDRALAEAWLAALTQPVLHDLDDVIAELGIDEEAGQ